MKKLLFVLFTIFAACHTRDTEIDPNTLGYAYFPLEKGRFVIYDVEETTYSITAGPVISTYQVKEVVGEKYTDLSSQEAFQIHRYIRSKDQDAWKQAPDSVWTARKDASRATRTENNTTFVKLIFPLKENTTWDGNRLNNQGKEEYTIKYFKKPFNNLEIPYENTVTVIQSNTDDLCSKNVQYEVYAANIGLIYKEKSILAYQQVNNQCDTAQKISYGVVYIQKLAGHGQE